MSIILDLFRPKTTFQKALLASSILNDSDPTVDLNHIKVMLQGFPSSNENEQLVQSMTILQIFKEFIRLVPKNPPSIVKLKVIITCNVLLGDLKYGRLLAPQFQLWGGWKNESKDALVKVNSSSKEILVKFIHSYQGVLQKITINHDILLKSKLQSGTQILFKNISLSLTIFYKVVNMLNYVFQLRDIFELAAATQNQIAVMEAFLLVWNDVIALYLYFERFILQFLDCYQQIDSKESLQVYELFRDFLLCSDKIQNFYLISTQFLHPSNLKEPRWTKIDKKVVDEVYLFFQNVRIFSNSRRDKNNSLSVQKNPQMSDRELPQRTVQMSDRIPLREPIRKIKVELEQQKIQPPKLSQFGNQYTFETEAQNAIQNG